MGSSPLIEVFFLLSKFVSNKDATITDLCKGGRKGGHCYVPFRRYLLGLRNRCGGLIFQAHSFGESVRGRIAYNGKKIGKETSMLNPTIVLYVVGIERCS